MHKCLFFCVSMVKLGMLAIAQSFTYHAGIQPAELHLPWICPRVEGDLLVLKWNRFREAHEQDDTFQGQRNRDCHMDIVISSRHTIWSLVKTLASVAVTVRLQPTKWGPRFVIYHHFIPWRTNDSIIDGSGFGQIPGSRSQSKGTPLASDKLARY
jgi:hypothetical protein